MKVNVRPSLPLICSKPIVLVWVLSQVFRYGSVFIPFFVSSVGREYRYNKFATSNQSHSGSGPTLFLYRPGSDFQRPRVLQYQSVTYRSARCDNVKSSLIRDISARPSRAHVHMNGIRFPYNFRNFFLFFIGRKFRRFFNRHQYRSLGSIRFVGYSTSPTLQPCPRNGVWIEHVVHFYCQGGHVR